ncbi:hypothetical protein [Chroococcidiopsis sp.]|uniref:hypothetical protein n=1 Tax=Chroococcidiopsis sp. TaxID=3088168 RepID=UPI003F3FE698
MREELLEIRPIADCLLLIYEDIIECHFATSVKDDLRKEFEEVKELFLYKISLHSKGIYEIEVSPLISTVEAAVSIASVLETYDMQVVIYDRKSKETIHFETDQTKIPSDEDPFRNYARIIYEKFLGSEVFYRYLNLPFSEGISYRPVPENRLIEEAIEYACVSIRDLMVKAAEEEIVYEGKNTEEKIPLDDFSLETVEDAYLLLRAIYRTSTLIALNHPVCNDSRSVLFSAVYETPKLESFSESVDDLISISDAVDPEDLAKALKRLRDLVAYLLIDKSNRSDEEVLILDKIETYTKTAGLLLKRIGTDLE